MSISLSRLWYTDWGLSGRLSCLSPTYPCSQLDSIGWMHFSTPAEFLIASTSYRRLLNYYFHLWRLKTVLLSTRSTCINFSSGEYCENASTPISLICIIVFFLLPNACSVICIIVFFLPPTQNQLIFHRAKWSSMWLPFSLAVKSSKLIDDAIS